MYVDIVFFITEIVMVHLFVNDKCLWLMPRESLVKLKWMSLFLPVHFLTRIINLSFLLWPKELDMVYLEISVDYPSLVAVLHSWENLPELPSSGLLRHPAELCDVVCVTIFLLVSNKQKLVQSHTINFEIMLHKSWLSAT